MVARDFGRQHRAGLAQAELAHHGGVGQHLFGGAGTGDAAGLQHHHGGGEAGHLGDRVTDVEDRQAGLVAQPFEIGQDLFLAGRIQRRERLVH